jgi:AcrR family transcriptional regulator
MSVVSTPYEAVGRVQQKRRTRAALIEAARDLAAQGSTPTVEEAAAAAGVSRTTAYRYFTSQRALLVAAYPEFEASSLLPPGTGDDPEVRLAAVIETFTKRVVELESQHRTALRLSLEATPEERERLVVRQGRGIRWIEEALAPLGGEIPEADLRRLVLAIRAAAGIEALVWLTDVAGLGREDAVAVMRWSAVALLRAARAEHVGELAANRNRGAGTHRKRAETLPAVGDLNPG